MATETMSDHDVELEIERLKASEAVKLAQKERQYLYRRRQYMYTLRWYEKRGKELIAKGMTLDDYDFTEPQDGGEQANGWQKEAAGLPQC